MRYGRLPGPGTTTQRSRASDSSSAEANGTELGTLVSSEEDEYVVILPVIGKLVRLDLQKHLSPPRADHYYELVAPIAAPTMTTSRLFFEPNHDDGCENIVLQADLGDEWWTSEEIQLPFVLPAPRPSELISRSSCVGLADPSFEFTRPMASSR